MQKKKSFTDKENEHLGSVRDFFDGHAPNYKKKYDKRDIFYKYFFYERLIKATQGIDFEGKAILDIGAGTGPLYDYLLENGLNNFSRYDATDISKGMLDQSAIPQKNQFEGDFLAIDFGRKYDLIFMLGVSTYLSKQKMVDYLEKVQSLLSNGGIFVITFTHNNSLDIRIRNFLTPLFKAFVKTDKVLAQSFQTKFYSVNEACSLFESPMLVSEIYGLNHTVFPVSRIAPGISTGIARRVSKLQESKLKRLISSDLLMKVIKE